MKLEEPERSRRIVAIWLLTGIGMLIIQVLLGGITRLTGSGLSITEWKPILGALPPINQQEWNEAFDKYKRIAQFKVINSTFTLHDFKSIFFWEWLHRLWARLIAVAFLIPFLIFLIQQRFKKEMIRPMIILFLLGALQGLVGWLMVMSGLNEENIYVSHYRLAIHFILAMGLICYTFWFALELLVASGKRVVSPSLKNFTGWIIALMVVQLIYGAFMAGLKAGPFAPTWPGINGYFYPSGRSAAGGISQYFDDPLMVQFIHRSLAYIIAILVLAWWLKAQSIESASQLFKRTNFLPLAVVSLQVLLGIITVLNSPNRNLLIWFGSLHQFFAMVLLLAWLFHFYLLKAKA
jgi:cytochrome c oxidase assembly protein subunit 15